MVRNKNVYKYDEVKRAEHMAVRESVGWYYWTHQLMEVTGKDAAAFLDRLCANPVTNLAVGRDRYTTILNESGEIIDDVVVLRLEDEKFWVSTLFVIKLGAWFDTHKGDADVQYTNVSKAWDMYAVQGPKARELVSAVAEQSVVELKFFAIMDNTVDGIPVKINRGGFTGEKWGYEIYIAPEQAEILEAKLQEQAEALGGRQVVDFQVMALSLPTEAGFYYMRDLMHTNPYEVGLDRGIKFDREFVGKDALLKIKEAGPAHEMLGFTVAEADNGITHKAFGGPGDPVLLDGEEVGRVSKITYSYIKDICIGYLLAQKGVLQAGDWVSIHGVKAVICEKPFI